MVDDGSLALFCTPAINLFPKRLDRVALGTGQLGIPRGARPHASDGLRGPQPGLGRSATAAGAATVRRAARFQAAVRRAATSRRPRGTATTPCAANRAACRSASAARAPRVVLCRRGGASSRWSTRRHGPFREELRQLSVTALVTNRDLPMLLPPAGRRAERCGSSTPRARSPRDCLRGPTRPVSRAAGRRHRLAAGARSSRRTTCELGDDPARAAAALRDTCCACTARPTTWPGRSRSKGCTGSSAASRCGACRLRGR